MSEKYREFVELYASQFKYESYESPGNKKYFVNNTEKDCVLMTHKNQSKHVVFLSKKESKLVKAGDLLLCVLEDSGIFKEETF